MKYSRLPFNERKLKFEDKQYFQETTIEHTAKCDMNFLLK